MTDVDELLEEIDRLATDIKQLKQEVRSLKLLYRLQYPEEMAEIENGGFVFDEAGVDGDRR